MGNTANSTVAPFPSRAAIKQEAGAWIVKIDQRALKPAEIKQLQQWLAKSDFHRRYLEKLAHNWDAMAVLQELADLYPISTSAGPVPRLRNWWAQSPITNRTPAWAGALASIAIAAVLVTSWLSPTNHYQTAIGQQASYQLPDGTEVVLNTNSAIELDYSPEQRIVRLSQGEAHFNVAKNPQRPFVVYAGEGMVMAVGTAFNVRYLDPIDNTDRIDVLVTEGTVKVYADATDSLKIDSSSQGNLSTQLELEADGQTQALVPAGQAVQYSTAINTVRDQTAEVQERKLAWQRGALVFEGETLAQALQEISRYTTKQIVITDPTIRDIRVGGHYKVDDIDRLLASLGQGFDIEVQHHDSQIQLSAKR